MAYKRDNAADQLKHWKEERGNQKPDVLTTGGGNPVSDKLNLLTVGPRGPLLVQDVVFTDEMAHFDRERIPERVVHAKGAGAFGYLEVTHDITKYCKAKVFEYVGKRTPLAVRFSTVAGESGSSDTVRDPRGFAVKLYTEDGNWDLTGNNTPIFFIRDAMLFPSFIHSQKRNPQTHMKDPDMVWDFWALRPESLHQVSFLFSDRGIPDGHRHMNGYGSHTFKLVNCRDEAVYCKFHFKTDQGIRNLTVEEANHLAASDPDYGIHDLYEAIATGNFPSWTFYIQVMTFEQAEKFPFNPFDLTKIWPHKDYPLIPVGKMVLNRNPVNYFVEVEQAAFDPSNMPPGIEPSPDKMLQGRLFSYPDTHRHRLGANYLQLPVNCPYKARVANYQRDGPMCFNDNQGGAPNYFPNSFSAPDAQPKLREHKFRVSADVARYNSSDEDNVTQVRDFYTKVLSEEERQRLCENIAGHLKDAQLFIQKRAVKNFTDVHPDYGSRIQKLLDKYNAEVPKKKTLYQEVTIMQMLDHPNIVTFYEVIDSKDKLYIVMEYVSGGNLQKYLINNGPMEEKKARHIFRQMVSALHYCHQKYVAHRDVKSMNILIDSEGNIKIADFGISSIYNPGIKMARYSGTPTHFPPEYYLRLNYYGPEVDVWCLGVVLYQMVTGTLPFNKLYQEEQRQRVLGGDFIITTTMSVDCINLLNVLLALRISRRESLEPIMKHPWFNKGYVGDFLTSNEEPSNESSELDDSSTPTDDEPECSRGPPIKDGNDAKKSSISPKPPGENRRISRWRRIWNNVTGVFSCYK